MLLVPRPKGSRIAQSVETSNAESPTNVYIKILIPLISWHNIAKKKNERNGYNTPMRRPRCFVFDRLLEFARFLGRQNQSARYAFVIMYVSACFYPLGC